MASPHRYPWQVSRYSGDDDHAQGFYVFRSGDDKGLRTEWMLGENGKAKRFETADEARAAIEQVAA